MLLYVSPSNPWHKNLVLGICCLLFSSGFSQQTRYIDSLFSNQLGEQRLVQIQLPAGYAVSDKSYPVLFVLDGEYIFDYAAGVANFLSNDFGFHPQMIVIGIPNTNRNRDLFVDFTTEGTYRNFVSFLEKEVIPYTQKNYRVNGFQILYGWSSGSGIANYFMVQKPSLFRAYILAGSGIGPKTEAFIKEGLNDSFPSTFLFASSEGTTPRATGLKRFQKLMETLKPDGLHTKFKIYEQSSHVEAMPKGLYDGLKHIFEAYQIPGTIQKKGSKAVWSYYKNLAKTYGVETVIPVGAINEISSAFIEEGRTEDAMELLRLGIVAYPESESLLANKAALHASLNQIDRAIELYKQALAKATSEINKNKYTIRLNALEARKK